MSRAHDGTALDAVPFLDLTPTTQAVRDQVLSGWSALLDGNAFI